MADGYQQVVGYVDADSRHVQISVSEGMSSSSGLLRLLATHPDSEDLDPRELDITMFAHRKVYSLPDKSSPEVIGVLNDLSDERANFTEVWNYLDSRLENLRSD
ncbi:hypothetical protein ISS07_03450 [Candidatus Woesearchaeota archaeon]|nr:hypothetical protein [Candidatus Woesearchaeota archaeon]